MAEIGIIDHSKDLYEGMGVCDKKCFKCVYHTKQSGENGECNYLLMEGHRRPCKAGKGCTVYKGKAKRGRKRQ